MSFETTLSSIHVAPTALRVHADRCAAVALRSEIDLPGFAARSFGVSVPIVWDAALPRVYLPVGVLREEW